MIAVLYVDPRGPYPSMHGVDAWDADRDARRYSGPGPVVAHPPCGPWGRLRHQCKREHEAECAIFALEDVRRFGGVLEHPAHSLLWEACALPKPGDAPDVFGGWTLRVNQCDWGHVARKPTWLYIVGLAPADLPARPSTPGVPTHCVGGGPWRGTDGTLKVCSAEQRRRTPPRFAEFLVEIARRSRR